MPRLSATASGITVVVFGIYGGVGMSLLLAWLFGRADRRGNRRRVRH